MDDTVNKAIHNLRIGDLRLGSEAHNKHDLLVMNQNNMTLLVLGLSLAIVAMLAVAPVLNNEEMAYASNASGGGAGGLGGSSSSSASVACNPPTTCSLNITMWRAFHAATLLS